MMNPEICKGYSLDSHWLNNLRYTKKGDVESKADMITDKGI